MQPQLILFVSRRGWKVSLPLNEAGMAHKIVYCRGRLPRRLTSIAVFWWTLWRDPQRDILTDTAWWIGLVAWLSARVFRRRYVLRLRGDAADELKQQHKAWHLRFFLNRLLPDAAGIIPVSRYLAEQLKVQAPHLEQQKVRVIPPPQIVWSEGLPFGERHRELLIVTSFRLASKLKRLQAFLPAIDSLLSLDPELRITIVGKGPLLDKFRRAVGELANRERILLPGFVENLYQAYPRSLALLHVSDLDAYPSVINEARACGLPVMVSDTVGLSEQVANGVDGIILDDEPDALIKAWNLVSGESEWMRLSRAGRERVIREHSHAVIGRQFVDALEEMLGRCGCKKSFCSR